MNHSHDHISDELLAKYLAKTASESELAQLHDWLARSPLHLQELEAFTLLWERAGAMHNQRNNVDTDAAWTKVRLQMGTNAENPNSGTKSSADFIVPVRRRIPVAFWAAAVISLLVASFTWSLFRSEKPRQPTLRVATHNNTTETILPDGTKVFLNYNSSISYPDGFDHEIRSVTLQGEAFFDVIPDATRPFVIQANGTEVKVLGTSFNVRAYKENPVQVDVKTGKVKVRKAEKEIVLSKGESAEVTDSVRFSQPNLNIMSYRTQIYDFQAANLIDITNSLRDGYHADVRLSGNNLGQCRLTIHFEKEPLDATLAVIAETLELHVRKDGEIYWLEGKGCYEKR